MKYFQDFIEETINTVRYCTKRILQDLKCDKQGHYFMQY